MSEGRGPAAPTRPAGWVLAGATLFLFALWSNSFIAIGYLLGSEGAPVRLDWVELTVARFLPAAVVCAVYCFGFRRDESWGIVREHWGRMLVSGALVVPGYNLILYHGQQHGVPAPVASLVTALVPFYVMILAAMVLGERPGRRTWIGFVVALLGMVLVSLARREVGGETYPLRVAWVALAPLCWSIFSVISKPLAGRINPILWTYLVIATGSLLVLPLLPRTLPPWSALDGPGWAALLYLSIPCTVLGFALWTWLLRHLPASYVGLTVFLNPPMTTVSKAILAAAMPAVFVFTISRSEWLGGGLTLLGLAVALAPRRRGAG